MKRIVLMRLVLVNLFVWRGNDDEPVGLEHASCFADEFVLVSNVFERFEANHQIE